MELPICKHRGPVNTEGRYPCNSAHVRVSHPSGAVLPKTCARCELADKGNSRYTPAPPQRLPSKVQMIQSFTTEMYTWVLAGMPRVTQLQLAERLAACKECPHSVNGACGLCGCPLKGTRLIGTVEKPGKAEMATTVCPDHKGCGMIGCAGVPRWKPIPPT